MKPLSPRTRNAKTGDGNGLFSDRRNGVSGQNSSSAHTFRAAMHEQRCYGKPNRSRSVVIVMLQNPAEAMLAFDITRIWRNDVAIIVRYPARQW